VKEAISTDLGSPFSRHVTATYRRDFAADLLQVQRLATIDTIFDCIRQRVNGTG
jgi:hypothetical protein